MEYLNTAFLQALKCIGCGNRTPPQAMLRLRGRLNVWCAVDCARGGLGTALPTPVSIPNSCGDGSNIAPGRGRCQALCTIPTRCRGQTFSPRRRITTTNPRVRLLVVIRTRDGHSTSTLYGDRFSGCIRFPAFAKCNSYRRAKRPMARCDPSPCPVCVSLSYGAFQESVPFWS